MKHLAISDLEESGTLGRVWVRNTAAQSDLGYGGEILLSIPGNAGQQAQALKIYDTWLPQDLTERYPKHRILESTDFRAAVRNGLLTIIDDATAKRIQKEDGAEEEQMRLVSEARKRKEAGAARTINQSANLEVRNLDTNKIGDQEENPVDTYGGSEEPNVAKAALAGLDVDENGLSPSFFMFASKMETETDIKALNAIKTRSKFSRRELKYLRDNLKSHPKTVAAVKTKLSAMASSKSKV
jgi:hypothetical protein